MGGPHPQPKSILFLHGGSDTGLTAAILYLGIGPPGCAWRDQRQQTACNAATRVGYGARNKTKQEAGLVVSSEHRSTRRPKAQLPPRHKALAGPDHNQNGDRDRFELSWVSPPGER